MNKKFVEKIVDLFYDKTKLVLFFIFAVGFILRIMAAHNLGVSADDVNHAIRPEGIFNSEKLVIWDQSTSLWYYIQGIFYNILGSSQLSSRFASVLFGAMMILVMYLFEKKVFKSERAAIISSALIAFSPLLIKETLPEMDIAASFFLILAAYFLFDYAESKSYKSWIFAAIIIGIGIMIKIYVAFFAASFIVFILFSEYSPKSSMKKTIKYILIFSFIVFILGVPTFTHNYLLHKDKGFVDLIFTNILKIGVEKAQQFYSWGAGWMAKSDYSGFFLGNQANFDSTPLPGFLIVLGFLLKGDPLLFILGILGLAAVYGNKREYFWFFAITFIPAFIYLGASIPMAKHFIWGLVLLAPGAGLIGERYLAKTIKIRMRYLIFLLLIFSLLYLGMPKGVAHAHFYGESSFGQVVDYKNNYIKEDSLIIADSRIYRGNIHWALAGTDYLEAVYFFDAINQLNTNASLQNIDVYYIECVSDDCGWGTVKNQPEFNASMENMTLWFANHSVWKKDFVEPDSKKFYLPLMEKNNTPYRIYHLILPLNPVILDVVKQTHSWYLYPIGYDRKISPIFDDYEIHSRFDSFLNKFAWLILYLEIALAFLAMLYIAYIFIEE